MGLQRRSDGSGGCRGFGMGLQRRSDGLGGCWGFARLATGLIKRSDGLDVTRVSLQVYQCVLKD